MDRFRMFLGGYCFVFLVFSTQAQLPTGTSLLVSSACAATLCLVNTTCRGVQACSGPACPPQPACLACNPAGADDVCNRNRYNYAVLVGDPSNPSDLQERKCDPTQSNDPPNCPESSVCISDGNGRGTCCYGKPENGIVDRTGVRICAGACGSCLESEICKQVTLQCIIPPCPRRYKCVPKYKEGSCSIWPAYIPPWCASWRNHQCTYDADCPSSYKCCSDQCSRRRCTRPRP